MSVPFVVVPGQAPRPLNVVGETITVLASSEQTGGYELFLQVGPEGSGPPPHNHPWDESFYVIRGEIALGIGQREMIATPGTLVHVPAGTTHWFRFGQGGCEMVSMTSREGASRLFADIDHEISPEQPDLGRLVDIAGRHGLVVVAPGELNMAGHKSKPTANSDREAFQAILQRLETAWNAYDSSSFAALFAEDASFIHIFGGQLDGRESIEAAHRVIFNTIYRGSHASLVLRSIRPVRPDVAVVFAEMRVNFEENNESRELNTRPTLIVVKEQANWQIVSFQNTRISQVPSAAQDAAHLAT